MSRKQTHTLTLDEWIEALNPTIEGDVVAYNDEVIKKLSKAAFKSLVYRNTFNKLLNIVMKTFKWTLPETMNERVIESGLLWRGWLALYDKPGVGKLCLPCTPTNVWTIYGEPTQVNVYGYNGYTEWVNIKQPFETPLPPGMIKSNTPSTCEGIVMRDNDRAYPYINFVKQYAYTLTDKIIAFNIATQRLKNPFYFVVNEKEMKDTITDLVTKIENNDDVIIRLKSTNFDVKTDPVQLQQNNMNPEVITHIKEAILFDFNQFLEDVGINTNPSPDKAQYVNNQEQDSNNSYVDISQDVRFDNRKKFCEDAKKMGVDISVEKNVDEQQQAIKAFKKPFEGGKDESISSKQQ